MANLIQQLIRRAAGLNGIANQLQAMQSTAAGLSQQNALLQQQLAIDFRNNGGFARFNNVQTQGFITDGYNASAAVYSIVSDICNSGASIPVKVFEVKDDKTFKKLKALKKMPRSPENDYKLFNLMKKALIEVDESNSLQALIDNPSPSQGTRTLFEQTAIGYMLLTGNTYISTPILDLGVNKGTVSEMFVMPSQYVGIVTTNGWPQRILGYELIVAGVQLYQGTEVLQARFPNYNYTIDGVGLYGLSPLYAGRKALATNINGETWMDASLINGGPKVIISREDWDGSERSTEQIGQQKQADKREYGGPANANKMKMMAGKINVHEVGLSPVDMDLIASQAWTFDEICNLFHVSSIMYNNKGASTESNVKEMRRDYWTRGVIPPKQAIVDIYNQKLVPLFNKKDGKKYWVELDTSGIPELQPDMAEQTNWLAQAYWLTPEEKREYQDFGMSEEPLMGKYYFPNNVVPLEDVSIPVTSPGDTTDPNAPDPNKP